MSRRPTGETEKEFKARMWKAKTDIWKSHSRDDHPIFAVEERLDKVATRIGKCSAQTIPGLAVKARHVAEYGLNVGDWLEPRDQLDWDKLVIRDLIENLCGLAGVDRYGQPVAGDAMV